ncbi:MAG: hypothetical protein K0Q80_2451 [Microvirga sp.]|nr:hypothetical protein [Microvirga sp.]
MKKTCYREEQIAFALRRAESGTPHLWAPKAQPGTSIYPLCCRIAWAGAFG